MMTKLLPQRREAIHLPPVAPPRPGPRGGGWRVARRAVSRPRRLALQEEADLVVAPGDEEEMTKSCKRCGAEKHQDDQPQWFCPDCILAGTDPAFLDKERDARGELKRPLRARAAHQTAERPAPGNGPGIVEEDGQAKGDPEVSRLLQDTASRGPGQRIRPWLRECG